MDNKSESRIARVYYDFALKPGDTITLTKEASHHLQTVLRKRSGDFVELFNGDGYRYKAQFLGSESAQKSKLSSVKILDSQLSNTESRLSITLVQAISRGDRMDLSIRQSVELGVKAIQPVYSRYSIKPLDEKKSRKKMDHWQKIVISASEQCGRTELALLHQPLSITDWLSTIRPLVTGEVNVSTAEKEGYTAELEHATSTEPSDSEETQVIALQPGSTKSLPDALSELKPKKSIQLLIGPESGFDHQEYQQILDTGIQTCSLGPRVLRTETAGPSTIAITQALLGDLSHA